MNKNAKTYDINHDMIDFDRQMESLRLAFRRASIAKKWRSVRSFVMTLLAALALMTIPLLLSWGTGYAKQRHEAYYQEKFCQSVGGRTEVSTPGGGRVDCLTDQYAIEVDFAPKWAEAVGQSLYYAGQTGRKPAILLVMTDPQDGRFLQRLESVTETGGITVWTMDCQ